MTSRQLAFDTSKPAEGHIRTDRSAPAAVAGVDIAGFPQLLFTRTFGDPDTLFIPLLDAAREAHQTIERLCTRGESRDDALRLSGMQLASGLLRDSSFSLVARGMPQENLYAVDLNAGTMHVQTRLYAVVSRRTSFFKVEIAGRLCEGVFVVRNPVLGTVITQVEEDQMRQPRFFGAILAQDCLRAQMDQERFGRVEEPTGVPPHNEVRLAVTVSRERVSVLLRQKEEGGAWDIIDGRKQEWVGSLSADMEGSLAQVIKFIQQLFEQK